MQDGERQVAPTLDGIRRDHVARYEWAAKLLPPKSRIIDFACGVGYGCSVLADAGHDVIGYDIDAEALRYAQKHYFVPNGTTFICENGNTPGRLPACTAAISFETIEHLEDPRPLLKALREAAQVLLASVPNEAVFPWRGYAFHERHYTQTEFAALLAECGWEVTKWHGQEGDESDVEPGLATGRTLIAVAVRAEARIIAPPVIDPPPLPAGEPPQHVAILGMGPSLDQYTGLAKRAGGRRAYCNEVWGLNAVGDVIACDRVFHMDDVRIQEIRAAARPQSNIAAMLRWLKTHPGPIYTSRAHPDYPGLVAYPLADVLNQLPPFGYFNSTAAYAIAFAIAIGVKKISVFGFDFTYPNAHHAEKGRACVEFWLGVAVTKGIAVNLPLVTSLMDSCMPQAAKLYGYDTVDVSFAVGRQGVRASFAERESLPTADEIEAEYDHSAHPNPLVNAPA